MSKLVSRSKKVLVGILGGLVVLIGLVLVPYPGPGWLIVFAGLAILSTEFEFAEKVLGNARGKYEAWTSWLKRQAWPLQVFALLVTGMVVVTTVWLLNGFGIVAAIFGVEWQWVVSPLFK